MSGSEPTLPLPMRSPSARVSLLERVGGPEVVRRVTWEFYDRIGADPLLRPLFPEDMANGREKQALFLVQWMGGEPAYSARYGHPRLRRRHFPFVIDQRAAGRWLHHMAGALRATNVPEPEVAEILAALGPLAHQMVNADQDVPREPLGDVRMD